MLSIKIFRLYESKKRHKICFFHLGNFKRQGFFYHRIYDVPFSLTAFSMNKKSVLEILRMGHKSSGANLLCKNKEYQEVRKAKGFFPSSA